MINSLTYIVLVFISTILSILPRSFAIYSGKLLGVFLFYFIPLRKKVALYNIDLAFPNKSINEKKSILYRMYKHYGILIIEFLRQRRANFNLIPIYIDEKTKNILSRKEGAILMTAHLGNWEMIIPILNQFKRSSVVVRVQRNLGGDKFVTQCRQNDNIDLLPKGISKLKMVKAITNGHLLALASDQNAGKKGIPIKFFNYSSSIPRGASYFYYKTKCPIYIGFCILQEDSSYVFKLKELKLKNLPEQIHDLNIEINTIYSKMLEYEIKKYPEQYFWFHKKWDKKIYNDL